MFPRKRRYQFIIPKMKLVLLYYLSFFSLIFIFFLVLTIKNVFRKSAYLQRLLYISFMYYVDLYDGNKRESFGKEGMKFKLLSVTAS